MSTCKRLIKFHHIAGTLFITPIFHVIVPAVSGTLRTITKRKRKRTIFTTEQVEELEKYFSTKPYVTREDRQGLATRLNINDKAVKIWFQNRRLKGKRDQCQSPTLDELNPEACLDYLESQINEKTDQFGYVTLDDTMMGNLVNIIDSCLGNNFTDGVVEEPSNTCNSSTIYEPISPPDSTKEEENLLWQSHAPTKSLQTLLDFQNIS
ncbi:hypothetical protein O3G_MSEX008116 [Manduca sexta]|uniref:Homeobox domain-containing protein n=1 Tax=Manduca sexta TaxID=7130 RepID=A0A922CP03_MANSE|nr:hypothetical protein O3G_MSEX008116 [Manduca sexta]